MELSTSNGGGVDAAWVAVGGYNGWGVMCLKVNMFRRLPLRKAI